MIPVVRTLLIPDEHLALIYRDKAASLAELADLCQASSPTIARRLRLQGVEIAPRGRPSGGLDGRAA